MATVAAEPAGEVGSEAEILSSVARVTVAACLSSRIWATTVSSAVAVGDRSAAEMVSAGAPNRASTGRPLSAKSGTISSSIFCFDL